MPLIEPGKKAPAFTLKDQHGKAHRLSDYAGRPVVLYFYPKDDTPGCTQESCDFEAQLPAFKPSKAVVLRRQHPRREEQGEVRDQARPDVSAARRRRARGRGEIRRLAGEVALRPQVHGHRPDDVPDRRRTARWRSAGTTSRWTATSKQWPRRWPDRPMIGAVSLGLSGRGGSPFARRSRAFSTSRWNTNRRSAFPSGSVKLYCLPPRGFTRRFFSDSPPGTSPDRQRRAERVVLVGRLVAQSLRRADQPPRHEPIRCL